MRVLDGRSAAGIEQIRRALDDPAEGDALGGHASIARVLLEALVAGDVRAGLVAADRVLAAADNVHTWEAEARRLRGEFLAALGASPTRSPRSWRWRSDRPPAGGEDALSQADSLRRHLSGGGRASFVNAPRNARERPGGDPAASRRKEDDDRGDGRGRECREQVTERLLREGRRSGAGAPPQAGRAREVGAEVGTGDAVDPGDLGRLLEGAEAFLVLLPEDLADPRFMAKSVQDDRRHRHRPGRAGVGRVVLLEHGRRRPGRRAWAPAGLRELEQRLSRLDLDLLVLRSAFYMENLLAALPLIQSQNVNGGAIDAVPIPMIATCDVAAEAAARLLRRDVAGHQVKLLLGPEDVTMAAATRAIGERVGMPDLPYVQFPTDGVRGRPGRRDGMSEEVASLMVDMQLAMNRGWPFANVARTAESTTPTTLEAFLKEALL